MDERRRRLLYRSWRRGFRELDLVLGGFVSERLEAMGEDELDELELFLTGQDQQMYAWITGQETPPAHHCPRLMRDLHEFWRVRENRT